MSPILPVLAVFAAAAPAPQTGPDLSYTAQSTIVTTLDPSLGIYAAPPGIGYDGVAGLLITKPSGTYLCTGSLYGSEHAQVVTAAHCLNNATSVDAVFFPPGGGSVTVTSTSFAINPGYTGAVIDENDIGYINLGTNVDLDSYSFFTSDALGMVYDEVGFGVSGTGATGATGSSGLRRHGNNRFDFSGADPVFGGNIWGNQNVFLADFDNGSYAQDASCGLLAYFTGSPAPYCDLGQGSNEVLSSPGDSGGPLFVNGQIAAVASFGVTFFDNNGNGLWDVDNTYNSSFGEFGGYVPIAPHADWLNQAVVPEPATLLLMFTGLVGIGIFRRRRESQLA